jgi:hypothetical protein
LGEPEARAQDCGRADKLFDLVSKVMEKLVSIEEKLDDEASNNSVNKSVSEVMEKLISIEQKLDDKASNESVNKSEERILSLEDKLTKKLNELSGQVTDRVGSSQLCPDKIEELQQRLESKVDSLDVKVKDSVTPAVQECIAGLVKTQELDKAEEREIEVRKTSVIIHGMPESNSETASERQESDLLRVTAMLDELSVKDAKVDKLFRLGKKPTDDDTRTRPLKVVFGNEETKISTITKAKNLRLKEEGGWEKVFVHQDLTPKQREQRRKLVAEMKHRTAQGEKGLTIYRGAVVQKRAD